MLIYRSDVGHMHAHIKLQDLSYLLVANLVEPEISSHTLDSVLYIQSLIDSHYPNYALVFIGN